MKSKIEILGTDAVLIIHADGSFEAHPPTNEFLDTEAEIPAGFDALAIVLAFISGSCDTADEVLQEAFSMVSGHYDAEIDALIGLDEDDHSETEEAA